MEPTACLLDVEKKLSFYIEGIAAGQIQPVYAMNFSAKNRVLPSMLEKVPLHIDPSLNKNIDKTPGINVISHYLSGALSFSKVHPEDSYLTSSTREKQEQRKSGYSFI